MSTGKGTDERAQRPPLGARGSAQAPRAVGLSAVLLAAFIAQAFALASCAEARSGSADLPDTISRANVDGTGKELSFIETRKACGVAVDAAYIYWGTDDGIGRANLDGSGVNESFITGVGEVCALAVDASYIYWGTDDGIGRANLDGSGVNESFITGVGEICALAVNPARIYWISPRLSPSSYNALGRANLDGTGVDPNFIPPSPLGLFECAVAVDAAHVYWGDSVESSIGRANLDGSSVNPSLIPGASTRCGMALDASHIYWHDPYTGIARANLDGTEVNPTFITGGDPCGVALDTGHVYWSNVANPSMFNFVEPFVKRDRKRGTATLFVSELSPGVLKLRGRWVVKVTRRIRIEAQQELPVKPRGKAKKRLNRRGNAKVKAKVTYTPDGGEPNTQSKKIKLVKRR